MRLIIFIVSFVLTIIVQTQSAEPVKQTRSGACFDSGHPNYHKVRNYVATFKTLEDCIKSNGDKSIKTG